MTDLVLVPARRVRAAATRVIAMALVACVLLTTATGCFTQSVPFGSGGTGASEQEFNQWFVLWGLVPITEIEEDVTAAIGGTTDYTLTSEFTPIDCVINIFTSVVTVYRKSMIVEK